eukprot:TRINITY_DN47927_c0_g1_i2.p2 TRINITY_DN47927_c0_g1~~TRINITY_DN47927_c0_g1_i2.p2  ORF type:complete len:116 (-),score=28.22 TRINITY_DN47927_c0_g1_i2:381-728(-)
MLWRCLSLAHRTRTHNRKNMDNIRQTIESKGKHAEHRAKEKKKREMERKFPAADAIRKKKNSNNVTDYAARERKKAEKEEKLKRMKDMRLEIEWYKHQLGEGGDGAGASDSHSHP